MPINPYAHDTKRIASRVVEKQLAPVLDRVEWLEKGTEDLATAAELIELLAQQVLDLSESVEVLAKQVLELTPAEECMRGLHASRSSLCRSPLFTRSARAGCRLRRGRHE